MRLSPSLEGAVLRRTLCLAAALLGAPLACRDAPDTSPVVIPRATERAPESALKFGLPYHPRDFALVWLATDSILVAHSESYAAVDVSSDTCEGTGVYLVPASGIGKARALRTGESICGALSAFNRPTTDARGASVMFSVFTPAQKHGCSEYVSPTARWTRSVSSAATTCRSRCSHLTDKRLRFPATAVQTTRQTGRSM